MAHRASLPPSFCLTRRNVVEGGSKIVVVSIHFEGVTAHLSPPGIVEV